ncbi:succinic semialdehyde dehydrogenase [Mobilicoccus caccae]|uniref:Succinic semialdehyde dehydrogenase n=1 Tax=Mobilicoccus caccae TaxID=1859295 RepID=A0ABQ6IP41_9MICO|nr:succinic semialdehyde dehydrogenase [Mobilicoccus caccae]GMA38497.1 succinic semialdehyde dehydrogenase [Mobilicoccus caccae]
MTSTVADAPVLDPMRVAQLAEYAVTSPLAATMTTFSPIDGARLADLPCSTPEDVAVAVTGARAGFRSWSRMPATSRAAVLQRFHDLVLDNQVELLDLIQLETGKTRTHAFAEIVDAALTARYLARRAPGVLRPRRRAGLVPVLTDVIETRRPVGVVGVVAPWNYPLSMAVSEALPALIAGNAVVIRPDPSTSLTMLMVAELLARAGLPQRVLQVVLGDGPVVGGAVLASTDYVCFTGSSATGREVAVGAARRLVGASLELGGKNAMYVAADADLDRAVPGAVEACFTNAGQVCISMERIYLHESIATEFLTRFVRRVSALRVGVDLAYGADMGTLSGPRQLERVTAHVEDARAKGAAVLTGGRPLPKVGPYAYAPTVLEDVSPDMRCAGEETFGPVVSVCRVGSDAEFVLAANDTEYGLTASIWSRDVARARGIAHLVEAGTVNVNDGFAVGYTAKDAPMGGMKSSGIGRRHGEAGILRFTEPQTIATARGVSPTMPTTAEAARYTTGVLRLLSVFGRR